MKTWIRREAIHTPPARCRNCRRLIFEVPEVGWVDPRAGASYDLCPADRFGNHDPDRADGGR